MNEQRMPESIEFLGLKLKCLSYEEEVRDGALVITFRTDVTPDQHETIKQHWQERRVGNYGTVIRHAHDERPIAMRLGNPEWSQHEGYYKYSITLVEDKYDQVERPDFRLKDDKKRNELVLETAAKLEVLTNLLLETGLLKKSQLEGLQSEISRRITDLRYELRKQEDLDKST